MKPVFEIHHVTQDLFDLPLQEFVLTFDDGYQDQYTHFAQFAQIDTQKIYFIVPEWLDRPDFMSVAQILELRDHPDVVIGAHSYAHPCLKEMPLDQKIKEIHRDTDFMIQWFRDKLGSVPTKFCFPFNDRVYGIYETILRNHGFTEFYGDERIKPEKIVDPNWRQLNRLW
jgi:peptidoglycan/xylan/chitin deacetylase (PgdA/CDA1 family)